MSSLASLLVLPFLALSTPPDAEQAPVAVERAASAVAWVGCMAGGDEKRPPTRADGQETPRRSRKCRPFIYLNPSSPEAPAPAEPMDEGAPTEHPGLFGEQV
ncbi:MAG TPA: hypothetical protein VK610_03560 [Rhodothermales bacterium]|nr:hypothetical protein [Rhodothermales bacterium]